MYVQRLSRVNNKYLNYIVKLENVGCCEKIQKLAGTERNVIVLSCFLLLLFPSLLFHVKKLALRSHRLPALGSAVSAEFRA